MDCASFTNNWRWRMFELLGQVRSGDLPWMNADELHRRALDDMIETSPAFDLTTTERDELTQSWHRLRVWPVAPQALAQLRMRYTVVVSEVPSHVNHLQTYDRAPSAHSDHGDYGGRKIHGGSASGRAAT